MHRYAITLTIALFFPLVVVAQPYLETAADFEVAYLLPDSRDFQAAMSGSGQLAVGYRFSNIPLGIKATSRLSMTRHLKNESKQDGSLLQTEATKVLEFKREVRLVSGLEGDWGSLYLGGWVGRRSVHWMDRDCDCFYNWFPRNFQSAEEVKARRDSLERLPGIAYHDGLRPYLSLLVSANSNLFGFVGIRRGQLSVDLLGPAYRWHAVTLPYFGYRLRIAYTHPDFLGGQLTIGSQTYTGGLTARSVDGFLSYAPIDGVSFGVQFGRYPRIQDTSDHCDDWQLTWGLICHVA